MGNDRHDCRLGVLLVEDDPVSGSFLRDALLERYPVTWARNAAEAREATARQSFSVLLIDLHLPDANGEALLAELRAQQPPLRAPALALSAELDADQVRALLAAGFAACLGKPLAARTLRQEVARVVGGPSADSADAGRAPWDDAAALRALGGKQDALRSLRQLLRQDLDAQRQRIVQALAVGDADAMGAELHRLRAACGFCGAAELAACCAELSRAPDARNRQRFERAVDTLLASNT